MICRNRIWEELKQAKANIICIQKYTDKRRGYNRAYNGFVAITASAGALGTLLNDKAGDRIQGSMPKAVNVPPPPKPKKIKTKWENIIQQKTFLEQFQHLLHQSRKSESFLFLFPWRRFRNIINFYT